MTGIFGEVVLYCRHTLSFGEVALYCRHTLSYIFVTHCLQPDFVQENTFSEKYQIDPQRDKQQLL
jgi:hypothetical protein